MTSSQGTALITGASTGMGAIFADRLAKRGYDLILVARNTDRMTALAEQLHSDTGRQVDVLTADLTNSADLAKAEAALKDNPAITMLVNNATGYYYWKLTGDDDGVARALVSGRRLRWHREVMT